MNLSKNSNSNLLKLSEEEITCYETWYSIIQNFDQKYCQDEDCINIHDIPKIGIVTARFLKTSGLPIEILHEIWNIVDYKNEGLLNFSDFGKACRLVAFYQHEKKYPSEDLLMIEPQKLPYFDIEKFWNENSNLKYQDLDLKSLINKYFSDISFISDCINTFKSLDDSNKGFLEGIKIFNSFINSGLNREILKKIWNFSDLDNDGKLSTTEFIIFNTLVKISSKYDISIYNGISIQNIITLLNHVIKSKLNEKCSLNDVDDFKNYPVNANLFENKNSPIICTEIDNLQNEISDISKIQTILLDLKYSDIQLITRLSQKKVKLMNEHKELLQKVNEKCGVMLRNKDLINCLCEDIRFLKEANQMISEIDFGVQNEQDLEINRDINKNINVEGLKKVKNLASNSSVESTQKHYNRGYDNWVVFPSKDDSIKRKLYL